ncbi:acetyl-CoA C-acetyltransferase [Ferrithrix thermotolerans DSM 19514]|uniref:Probable acetyl-CoA acetyltransferase n=1 Tax=Ferrithrix thermotolerans DSM 19514 TaxID=1121881 RepID=A0A1M4TCX6_9ACTN|nr:acetyl-CoA C-acetyltransferase [Ferrithrix thermotolerans]SHE42283.1 acetyl-CoA C-acetyltransferase [Ferrithrix thermotolerans DSM 19514]
MSGSYILSGARTPIGKLSSSLSSFSAMELGGFAIKEALRRGGISPEQVDYVYMGQVLQAGQGQITARQAAVLASIPMSVPATTVNKVCLSGLNAIHLADLLIGAGEADIVVAGGMESMTNAPHVLPKARQGFRYGDAQLLDATLHDGLTCSFEHEAMGLSTDRYVRRDTPSITRQRQDEFAANSHERAASAIKSGRFAEEIVSVTVPNRKGDPTVVEVDEGVRPGTIADTLAKLKPAFSADGTVTAGNASQISDGAAAVVVVSERVLEQLGQRPLGRVLSYGQVAGPDTSLLYQPSNAISKALHKISSVVSDIDLFEINEAFAAVALASMEALSIPDDVVNVNGGAIALGHPIGASGTRLALTLLMELRRRGGGIGAAALCGGGGQGDALIVEAL